MAIAAEKPKLARPREVLEASIVGWGADLDRANRPGAQKERFNPEGTGAHWHVPERQIPRYPREKSTEHRFLTPVFGTVCPPKGLSGLVRRYAYTFSEGRLSHWLLLVAGDRIDVLESRVMALLRGRPDNPIAEMGLRAEIDRHGLRSRFGKRRADLALLPVDVLLHVGSTIATAAVLYAAATGVKRLIGGRTRARPGLLRLVF